MDRSQISAGTLVLLLTLTTVGAWSQTSYIGHIDKYPIQLVTYAYSDDDIRAIYAYNNHDTPIVINGSRKGSWIQLYERSDKGDIQAMLRFKDLDPAAVSVSGEWINRDSTRRLKITLAKVYSIDYASKERFVNRELMQPASTTKHYFKLLVSKDGEGDGGRVTGVKVYEKKTDRLVQTIKLECQLWGLDNVSVGDYNFDGLEDFSVFESSYAGPNTSSIYILKQPASDQYFVSDFSGTSLEFDEATRTITSSNSCCAGMNRETSTYEVVDNKMVLLKRTCYKYDEDEGDYKEVKCDE